MHWKLSLIAVLILVMLSACGGNKVRLPIETSLGNLVRIEKKDDVATDERTISPEGGKVLYLLSFEGKSEIPYEGEKEMFQTFTLVDSKGTESTPVFAGSPTNAGTLSNKEWKYIRGQLKAQNGRFVFVGVLSLPQPRLALVYAVPKDASGLTLKDGERRHAIN